MYVIAGFYNNPANAEAFRDHYLNKHSLLAQELPGIERFELHWTEPEDESGFILGALMYWQDKAAAMASFTSPAGDAAMADVPNFAGAGLTIVMGDVRPILGTAPSAGEQLHTLISLYEDSTEPADSWSTDAHGAREVITWNSEADDSGTAPAYSVIVAGAWDAASGRDEAASGAGGRTLSGTATVVV